MGGFESWRKYSRNNCNNHFHSNEVYNHHASNIEQIKRDLGALIYPSEAGPGAVETQPDIHRPLHELSLMAGCRVPDTELGGLLPVGLQAQPPKVTGDGPLVGWGGKRQALCWGGCPLPFMTADPALGQEVELCPRPGSY